MRPKLYGPRILLPLTELILEDIDERLVERETRLDFIRTAIANEIRRRGP